jgi:diguanylate cyclase (GGDEF)-like protein
VVSRRAVHGSRLPYVAVAVAYPLLLALAGYGHVGPLGGVIIGTGALMTAVALRQLTVRYQHRGLAGTDGLTGLANRNLVERRLRAAIRRHRRIGVLVIDLNRFAAVNDTLGHQAGDAVLIAVGHALRTAVRGDDLAGRLGGDRFAVVIDDLTDLGGAIGVARRVLDGVGTPVVFDGHVLDVTASIGIALSEPTPAPGLTAGDLLRQAEAAMRAAKRRGSSRYEVYTAGSDGDAREPELRQALKRGQLVLHYQPIVDLSTAEPVGVEALVRWQHPTRGLLEPAQFVPLAEQTGLIVPIGAWVLRQACEQLYQWSQQHPKTSRLALSVNLAARQLRHPSLVSQVSGILRETGFDPRRLVLELSEETLVPDDAPAVAKLEALRGLGVRVAIDDFGAGSSTLSALRRLPIDIIKIDKSFLDDDGRALAPAVIGLGQALRLGTVAEGIETAGQLAALRRMHCDQGQGFLFARPLPPAEALAVCTGDSLRTSTGEADCQTTMDG